MLKKYQVLELKNGAFTVALLSDQYWIGGCFGAKVVRSNSIGNQQFEKAAEAQELADDLNGPINAMR